MKPHLKELLWQIPLATALTAGAMYGILKAKICVDSAVSQISQPSVTSPAQVEQKAVSDAEYDSVIRQIKGRGYEVEPWSFCVPGAKTTIVYLPDWHKNEFQLKQVSRILDLDQNIKFDAVGLEGLIGKVDSEECAHEIQAIDEFIDSMSRITMHESDVHQVRGACSGIEGIFQWRNCDKKASEEYDAAVRTMKQMLVPSNSDVVSYLLNRQFSDWNNSPNAPGRVYGLCNTRAAKVGMESGKEWNAGEALYLLSFMRSQLRDGGANIERCLSAAERVQNSMSAEESEVSAAECTPIISKFERIMKGYFADMQQRHDALFDKLDDEQRKAVDHVYNPDGSLNIENPVVNRAFLADSTAAWVNNLKGYSAVLLVGGSAHSRALWDECQKQGCSLIALSIPELKE